VKKHENKVYLKKSSLKISQNCPYLHITFFSSMAKFRPIWSRCPQDLLFMAWHPFQRLLFQSAEQNADYTFLLCGHQLQSWWSF
jgi:hypothetical protein